MIDNAAAEVFRLSSLLEEALSELIEQTTKYAIADDEYRMRWAKAYTVAEGTAPHRKALADLATSKERREVRIREGLKVAALETVRSRRTQISAVQSLLAAHRAEAEFVRTGPEGGS